MHEWERLRRAIAARALPCAVVDLDALERNVDRLIARAKGVPIRLATKSVRSPLLVHKIVARSQGAVTGLMTFTAAESALWAERADTVARDLLLAYPTVQPSDLEAICAANARSTCAVVVDDRAQVEAIAARARARGMIIPLCIEIDVAWRPLGDRRPVGVRRSPLFTVDKVVDMARAIAATAGVRFHGVMAYEAHIAGLTDDSPFHAWQNHARRAMKRLARPAVAKLRGEVVRALGEAGLPATIVNGGGTGSLDSTARDASVSELTIGSGCLAPHLFDYYADLALEPAAWFALQVVRRPSNEIVTCLGGGYVASGGAGRDRLPLPALPEGATLLALEGAGEVQTPVRLPRGVTIALGDPMFFRHAKAGELAEHFDEYLCVRGDQVVESARTYRGMGRCFLG